ncbi:MAG: transporter [Motiliproteus sp.]
MRRRLRLTPATLLIVFIATTPASAETLKTKLERLEMQLSTQQARIEAQEQKLEAQSLLIQQQHRPTEAQLSGSRRVATPTLEQSRGAGRVTHLPGQSTQSSEQQEWNAERSNPLPRLAETGSSATSTPPQNPVGKKPDDNKPAQSTLSTSKRTSVTKEGGGVYFEPSLSFVHSSSNRVAVEGFSIIPSIVVGLINIQETRRDTLTAALNFRYALTDRLELGLRVPYLQRSEDIRGRELFSGVELASLVSSSGSGLGDIVLSAHYKITPFTAPGPYYTANLRVKTTTGDGPFDVPRRQVFADTDNDVDTPDKLVGEFFLKQPTGSGFYSIEPSIAVAYPTDPAVLYGSFGYMWNLAQDSGTANGEIDPGDAINLSIGMGFAINETTSFNMGYGHSVILETDVELGDPSTNFSRLHVGSLKFGVNMRLDTDRSANFNISVGATADAPDMQLTIGFPFSF